MGYCVSAPFMDYLHKEFEFELTNIERDIVGEG